MPNYHTLNTSTIVMGENSPFDFPFAGQLKMNKEQTDSGPLIEMLNVAGEGVIREIQIIFETGSAITDLHSLYLDIYYDGEVTPSIAVPVSSIFGYETATAVAHISPLNQLAGQANYKDGNYETPFLIVATSPAANDGFEFSGVMKYPIPFTNGIIVKLRCVGGVTPTFWWTITYSDELATSWNRNLRFYLTRSNENLAGAVVQAGTITISGTAVTGVGTAFSSSMQGKFIIVGQTDYMIQTVTDITHLVLAANDAATVSSTTWSLDAGHTWLSRAAGKQGWLASVMGGMNGTSTVLLEANTRIRLDGEAGCSMMWSGTEDFFLGSFYWEVPDKLESGGIVSFDAAGAAFTAYRMFYDVPVRYVNGIIGVQPNTTNNPSSAVQQNWTVGYYEEVP